MIVAQGTGLPNGWDLEPIQRRERMTSCRAVGPNHAFAELHVWDRKQASWSHAGGVPPDVYTALLRRYAAVAQDPQLPEAPPRLSVDCRWVDMGEGCMAIFQRGQRLPDTTVRQSNYAAAERAAKAHGVLVVAAGPPPSPLSTWEVWDPVYDPERRSGVAIQAVSAVDAAELAAEHDGLSPGEPVLFAVRGPDGVEKRLQVVARIEYTVGDVP